MNTLTDKTNENKSQSVANKKLKKKGNREPNAQWKDQRPEAIIQGRWQSLANKSLPVNQLKAYQELADRSNKNSFLTPTVTKNLPGVTQRSSANLSSVPVIQREEFHTSNVIAIAYPENTAIERPDGLAVYTGGFNDNEQLKNLGIYYLVRYYNMQAQTGDGEPARNLYVNKIFNAALPINGAGNIGFFEFKINAARDQATVFYRGGGQMSGTNINDPGGVGVRQKLMDDFGIASIEQDGRAWQDVELNKIYNAFNLLGGNERGVLQGMRLIRVPILDEEEGQEDGHSHTLALFSSSWNQHTPRGIQVLSRMIKVSDRTFRLDTANNGNAASFIRSESNGQIVPMSFQTIIHEVGHAVEKEDMLANLSERNQRLDALREVETPRNHLVETYEAARTDMNARSDHYQAVAKAEISDKWESLPGDDLPLLNEYRTQFSNSWATAPYNNPQQALPDAYQAVVNAAEAALAARRRFMPLKAQLEALDERIRPFRERYEQARAVAERQANQSYRLGNFVRFVNDNHIQPTSANNRFTHYAADEWPGLPGEYYAEAYSLFRLNPSYLQSNHILLYNYFNIGHHLHNEPGRVAINGDQWQWVPAQ